MLSVRELEAGYGAAAVLRGVSLEVGEGETVALVGANGAGKSTLLKAISGLVRVRGGEIRLDGTALTNVRAPQRVARGIAHVPEGREIFGGLTVGENLGLGAYAVGRHAGAVERARRLDEVTSRFPMLRDRLHRPAAELSGGQQQMLAIGRGLMVRPRVLLLDEPSLGLSPSLVEQIFTILRELRRDGVAVLIAEQNARMTLAVADRGYVLENGRIVAAGTGAELLASPQIVERYLGVGSASLDPSGEAAVQAMTSRLRAILDPVEAAT